MKTVDDLEIYKKSLSFVTRIYQLIHNHSNLAKDFSLVDQIKRASISISANISEGYFRSVKQTKNYLEIASVSTNEVITLLTIIQNIYKIETIELQSEYKILGKQINAFSNSLPDSSH